MPELGPHERALELAIASLDFDLEPADRAWLDAHLEECASCRRERAAYAADARALERLPQVSAPARVEARVLGRGRGTPRAPAGAPRWLALAAAIALVATIGGVALNRRDGITGPGASLVASQPGTATPATVPSTAVASAAPTAMARPTPPPTVGPLAWTPLDVPDQAPPREIRALSGGSDIAVATFVGANGEPRLWWSREGGPWQDAELPVGAFGGTAPWLVEPFRTGFIALGWRDITRSAMERRIWVSPDGLAWRANVDASADLGPVSYGLLAAAGDRVLAAGRADGETFVWRSTDGETWTRLTIDPAVRDAELAGLVAIDGGFVAFGVSDDAPVVWRTPDGERWTSLPPPPGLARVDGMTASAGGIVASGATEPDRRTANAVTFSPDGESWAAVAPPAPVTDADRVVWITDGPDGLVGQWRLVDGSVVHGSSTDGRTWAPLAIEGLPPDVSLDWVRRVGDRLVGLGRDADRNVVSFVAGGG